jgi:hypothetical protein
VYWPPIRCAVACLGYVGERDDCRVRCFIFVSVSLNGGVPVVSASWWVVNWFLCTAHYLVVAPDWASGPRRSEEAAGGTRAPVAYPLGGKEECACSC